MTKFYKVVCNYDKGSAAYYVDAASEEEAIEIARQETGNNHYNRGILLECPNNTLVIHPEDPSTEFLSLIYENKDYDVIRDTEISQSELMAQILSHDRIIMMGHGCGQGLFNPKTYARRRLLIDDSFADILKTKETVSIWCWSDEFFEAHDIPGFHTGMIISEVLEQQFVLGKVYLNEEEQLENMQRFAKYLGECIEMKPEEMKEYMLAHYTGDDEVTKFNRKNIRVLGA